jgi:DNA-binding CsgD family transcriptional regulator
MLSLDASLAASSSLGDVVATLTTALRLRVASAVVDVVSSTSTEIVRFPTGHDIVSRNLTVAGRELRVLRVGAPTLSSADVAHIEALVPMASLAVAAVLFASEVGGPAPDREAGSGLEPRLARVAYRWRLTPRQCFVLGAAARGLSNKEIATSIGASVRTVEAHMSQILAKSGAASRGGVVAKVWSADVQGVAL